MVSPDAANPKMAQKTFRKSKCFIRKYSLNAQESGKEVLEAQQQQRHETEKTKSKMAA